MFATYADETAILCQRQYPFLQAHLTKVEYWVKLWQFEVNNTKSLITFQEENTCSTVVLFNKMM